VPVVYFDSSALVKLLVEEVGSELSAALWDACDAPFSSPLAYSEVRAALAAARRNRELSAPRLERLKLQWEQYWSAIEVVELRPAVAAHAGELAEAHGLRGADAIHLASALVLRPLDVVMTVWDRRLHSAAAAERVGVAPTAAVLGATPTK
jgi:uncharacterized protein